MYSTTSCKYGLIILRYALDHYDTHDINRLDTYLDDRSPFEAWRSMDMNLLRIVAPTVFVPVASFAASSTTFLLTVAERVDGLCSGLGTGTDPSL